MGTVIASSNLSLSNLIALTLVDNIAPYSASNLYNATNVSSLPNKTQPLGIGFFRGLNIVPAVVVGVPVDYTMRLVPQEGITLVTNSVSSWIPTTNSSMGNVNFSQATSTARPTFNATGGGTNSQMPYLNFASANNQFLQNSSGTWNLNITGGGGFTMVYHIKFNTSQSFPRIFTGNGTGSWLEINQNGTALGANIGQVGAALNAANYSPVGTWILQAVRWNNSTRVFEVFRDSITTKTSTTSTSSVTTNLAYANNVLIGKSLNADPYLNADIAWMYMYNRALSDAELTILMNANGAPFIDMRANALTSTPVQQWSTFTQSTVANRPLWSSTGGYNNGKYVAFTGSPLAMIKTTSTTFPVSSNGGITFAMLYKITAQTVDGWERVFQSNKAAGGEAFVVSRWGATNDLMIQLYNDAGQQVVAHKLPSGWAIGTWKVMVFRYKTSTQNISFWQSTSTTPVTIDIANPAVSATATVVANNLSINANECILGAQSIGFTPSYGMLQLGGMFLYNRSLTDNEVQSIFSFYQNSNATA